MAKPLTLNDLMQAMEASDKKTVEAGGELKYSKSRKELNKMVEEMKASIPPSGIISREYTKNPDASAVVIKALAADMKSIKGLQQAILKEAKDTNNNIVNLTKVTLGGIDKNSDFMEANQELIDRLLIRQELNDDEKKKQGVGQGGEGSSSSKDDKKGATDFSLVGALAAGLLPFIGDLKNFIEQSGMWILEIPKSIENSVIAGMTVASKILTNAFKPESLTKIVKDALFPSAADKPQKVTPTPDSSKTSSPDVEDGRPPTQIEEPNGKGSAGAADDAVPNSRPSPDGKAPVTPEPTTPRPAATEPAKPPTRTPPRTSVPSAGKAAGKVAENADQLVQKKFGQRLANYIGGKVAVMGAKALPVAGIGLSLWDGLAALSNNDWHRVTNNAAMGVGGVLDLTGIGAPAGVALQAVGLTDAILHDIYSSIYTNQDGSPADYIGDFRNNRSLFDQRMVDLKPAVEAAVQEWIAEQYKSIMTNSIGKRTPQPFRGRYGSGGNIAPLSAPNTTETLPPGETSTYGMDDSLNMGFDTPQSSMSTMGVPPPTPVPRITQQQVNTIGNPAVASPSNVIINKQGDTVNNITNGGNAGGGGSGVSGSPSRAPSPFDYLLYGDSFNWGY